MKKTIIINGCSEKKSDDECIEIKKKRVNAY